MNRAMPTLSDLKEARNTVIGYTAGSLAIMLVVQLLSGLFTGDPFIRLVLMVLWFSCLLSVTWGLTEPFSRYFTALNRWRYAEAGPAILHTSGKYAMRVSRIVGGFGWTATVAGSLCCLFVLSHWPEAGFLTPFQGFFKYGWWLAMSAIPAYMFFAVGSLKEILQLRQELREQAELSGARVRDVETQKDEERAAQGPAVEITGPQRFRAGGYDWHWGDYYKNVAIFGMSGSGKTLCVLNAVLDGLIGSANNKVSAAAGLILDPKGDFRNKIAHVCRKHGRASDLIVIDPYNLDTSARFNPLDTQDNPLEVAGRFTGVMETLSEKSSEDAFWIDSVKTFIQNILPLLRAAKRDMPPDLIDIYQCATSDAALSRMLSDISEAELEGNRTLTRAFEYVTDVWDEMGDKPKSTVRTFISNMLGPFLQEPYDDLFIGKSTKTMAELLDEGKILYVYMPIADQETMARVVSTFVKLEFYREVLKRVDKDRPSFFLCDEFQAFFTTGSGRGDAEAFERTRQSNHANIVAFQNLPALLRQVPKEEPVTNMLGNCATKIFLRNTDQKTNEYASNLFGEQVETLIGTGQSGSGLKHGSKSVSANAQYGKKVRQDVFSSLIVPSREDQLDYAEAMCHLGARATVDHNRLRWKIHPLKA
ncbi:MAG: type IV secretory system conjugative DNA transfer family protein [Sphingomonadales bacterium]